LTFPGRIEAVPDPPSMIENNSSEMPEVNDEKS